jgi:hypothetical protein
MIEQMLEHIRQNSPTGLLTRAQVEELTGGLLNKKRLTDLDCLGKGIPNRLRAGRKVVYPVDSVCDFLTNFIQKDKK